MKEHTTVIFSTHILSDVERICDEVAFLHEGSIVMKGTLAEVKSLRKGTTVEVECAGSDETDRVLSLLPGGKRVSETSIIYEKTNQKRMNEMMKVLAEHDVKIQRIEMLEPTLEDLFVEVVSK